MRYKSSFIEDDRANCMWIFTFTTRAQEVILTMPEWWINFLWIIGIIDHQGFTNFPKMSIIAFAACDWINSISIGLSKIALKEK